jgi:hypothetical protein
VAIQNRTPTTLPIQACTGAYGSVLQPFVQPFESTKDYSKSFPRSAYPRQYAAEVAARRRALGRHEERMQTAAAVPAATAAPLLTIRKIFMSFPPLGPTWAITTFLRRLGDIGNHPLRGCK